MAFASLRIFLPVPPAPTSQRGFTLTELAVVLVIVALLIGGMMIPLSVQNEVRYVADTQRIISNAHEALLGYAAVNGRLPCPASATSNGQESFASGGDAGNGNCSNFLDGFLPAAALGMSPTDASGFILDAWGQRIHYATFTGTSNGVGNPVTRTDGIKIATPTEVAKATLLSVCSTATGITTGDCGTAARLTDKAPALIFSTGRNGGTAPTGTDEQANQGSDPVFVFHDPAPSTSANGEFDDLVTWLSVNILFNRMAQAGRLYPGSPQ